MAEDVITLLDYVGWTAERDLHVVGVSLGGMIALGKIRRPRMPGWPSSPLLQSSPRASPTASSPSHSL